MKESAIVLGVRAEAALSNTYARGRQLVLQNKVESFSSLVSEDEQDVYEIVGKVAGSAGKSYSVMVKLDLARAKVLGHMCDCPAHAKYNGMCKHTVALALRFLGSRNIKGAPQPQAASSQPRGDYYTRPSVVRPKPAPLPPVRTSPQIEKLISTYAQKSVADARAATPPTEPAGEASTAPVELLCTITPADAAWRYSWSDDTWALGLKVVRGKVNYVVKSVADLVDAWHRGSLYRYGKNLQFAHRRESFTDRANDLLEILSKMVEAQASLYSAQESRNAYSYSHGSLRVPQKTLPVSTSQLVEILDLMQGYTVVLEESHYERYVGTRKTRATLAVGEGDPKLNVELRAGRDGSYQLEVTGDVGRCFWNGETLYVVEGKRLLRCSLEFAHDLGTFCSSLLPMDYPLDIREEDMPGFCAAVLPALRRYTNLTAPREVSAYEPAVPEFSFSIGLDHGFITCTPTVAYGEETLGLFEEAREGQPVRDPARELAAQHVVRAYFPRGEFLTPDYAHPQPQTPVYSWMRHEGTDGSRTAGNAYYRARSALYGVPAEPDEPWFYEEDDDYYYLLFAEGLRELSQLGEVLLSERLRGVTVRSAPTVRVDASVTSGLLDIEVTSDDMSPQELAAYLASYKRKQRYVRLKSGDIVRLDGSVEAVAGLASGLGLEPEDLVDGAHGLPTNRTLFVDATLKRVEGVRFERDRGFRQIVRDFETVADADFTPPGELRDILRPYQTEGFKWLCTLGSCGFGGILADDMGLGKTLQLLAFLEYARIEGEEHPALVVCPASLVYNWQAEAARFAPGLDVCCIVGSKAARRKIIATAGEHDLLVTSYDLMRRDVDELATQQFGIVALDEAQYVKNANTQAAKAARRLPSRVRFALTGTPIENRLLELWSIFDFLMPGVLGSADSFTNRFSNPIAAGEEGVAERLQRLVAPFILRRNKRDVLRDLPDKNEFVLFANMEGEQAKLYRASEQKLALSLRKQLLEEFSGQRMKILAELTKLRQLCCDPHLLYENYRGGSAKLETCMELVRQAVEGGHQLLLFSQFTSMFELIEKRLEAEKFSWLKLTGATSKEERVRLVERFQAGEASVFLISLKAGGTGLNLTAADVVIHYDPWWNLAAQNQATDRTHRIGQTREVSVFKLIAKDSIEERIVALQEAKHDLAESVLGGEATSSTGISRDDILALLDAR